MDKFKIPVIPKTTTRSIRFPDTVINDVENAIRDKKTSFNAFVVAATRYAINDLKNDSDEN